MVRVFSRKFYTVKNPGCGTQPGEPGGLGRPRTLSLLTIQGDTEHEPVHEDVALVIAILSDSEDRATRRVVE